MASARPNPDQKCDICGKTRVGHRWTGKRSYPSQHGDRSGVRDDRSLARHAAAGFLERAPRQTPLSPKNKTDANSRKKQPQKKSPRRKATVSKGKKT